MQETELGEQVSESRAGEGGRSKSDDDVHQWENSGVSGFWLKLLIAGVLFFIGSRVISFLLKLLKRSFVRAQMEEGSLHFINSLVKALLYVILVAGLATYLGVKEASIAAHFRVYGG